MPSPDMQLILASTSRYRSALLQRLCIPFRALAPQVEETRLPDEPPDALASRLARAKADAIAATMPAACVIGSDQVASVERQLLGKPGGRDAAIAQLRAMSGRSVHFHTAVSVRSGGDAYAALDTTTVRMRALDEAEIARYVDAEQPWDCAGSFKAEGLGIALFDAIDSRDPTALIGLPLIATAQLLRRAGFSLP
jgi:septum formation protein